VTIHAKLTDRETTLAEDTAIEANAPQPPEPAEFRTHDKNRTLHYLSAEDAEPHSPRHALELPGAPWPRHRGWTIHGVLPEAAMWFATSARR
jgi:hypothetical protein